MDGNGEKEVRAAEDLMREHGVLRGVLLAYSAAASRLRGPEASKVPAKPLAEAASLFRTFGEQYHERAVEERYVFPPLERLGGEAGRYPTILKAQHDRGRASADRAPLAHAMEAIVLMYQHHTAIEDTVVFPAWKEAH